MKDESSHGDERVARRIEQTRGEIAKLEKVKSKRTTSHDADEVRFYALMPASYIARDQIEKGAEGEKVWDAIFQCLMAGFFRRGRRLFLVDDKIKSLRAEGLPVFAFIMRAPHFKSPGGNTPQDIKVTDNSLMPDLLRQTWATVATWKMMCEMRNIPLPKSWQKAVERHTHFLISYDDRRGSNKHEACSVVANQATKLPRATDVQARDILEKQRALVHTKNAKDIIAGAGFYYPKNLSEQLATEVTRRGPGKPSTASKS